MGKPQVLANSEKTLAENCGPLSVVSSTGIPYLANIDLKWWIMASDDVEVNFTISLNRE